MSAPVVRYTQLVLNNWNMYVFLNVVALNHTVCLLISTKQYEKINGHPNWYWGWGVEDIDMSIRLRHNPANESQDLHLAGFVDASRVPLGARVNLYRRLECGWFLQFPNELGDM